jgi:hypothetical protein
MLTVHNPPSAPGVQPNVPATRVYFAEFNRTYADNIRKAARRLERWGLTVDIVPHKTTLRIERPPHMHWLIFRDAMRSVIHEHRGSFILFCTASGRVFLCSNVGNMPGVFQRLH